ncbi:MAG: type V CRISPR-associated endonuclease Cas1 [Clostridia bacterium]|nr:type V CRISPR-associated endonuclease Cas1 [Clostridia bacterium]
MISLPDFKFKQIVLYYPNEGEKIAVKNDNLVVKDSDGKIKFQVTAYRLFAIFVVGSTTITTEIIRKSKKYGFSICLFSSTMKLYEVIGHKIEGNTLLHKKQYSYSSLDVGKKIIENKIHNQARAISKIRGKTKNQVETIKKLNNSASNLAMNDYSLLQILGIEGTASKAYFNGIFDTTGWNRRCPRIKTDYINATLDIGYTILFNVIDALLRIYGFDTYYGVLHTCFYMRKSLVCDIMEPFRPIVDMRIRKGINWGEIKESDFKIIGNKYVLEWKNSPKYTQMLLREILNYKEEIFLYIQGYYRNFMKGPTPELIKEFEYK